MLTRRELRHPEKNADQKAAVDSTPTLVLQAEKNKNENKNTMKKMFTHATVSILSNIAYAARNTEGEINGQQRNDAGRARQWSRPAPPPLDNRNSASRY